MFLPYQIIISDCSLDHSAKAHSRLKLLTVVLGHRGHGQAQIARAKSGDLHGRLNADRVGLAEKRLE